jgi:polyketide synthase PksL
MSSKEIIRALQAGEISLEAAKEAIMKLKTGSGPLAPSGQAELDVRRSSLAPSSREPVISEKSPQIHQGLKPTAQAAGKESIAIIGMSGRYPDANNLEEYWDNLAHARNSVREIPPSRWDVNQYYDPDPSQKGKIYCKWLGALEGIEYFDPLFFNISPSEAEKMDPQQRIFLEEGYRAFEDAGYSGSSLSNKKCGVYLGLMNNEYGMILYKSEAGNNNTGNSFAIAAARLPYFLNLKGPAIAIDTACSSSLVATHLACQALLNHEIDLALAGGVTLYLIPESYAGMCAAGMLSREGQCKAFDNDADGLVPGEGAGALVLKRLKDAEADRDIIYGVIIASGINQDGKTNGITAPSAASQMELEREIYEKYQIHPESISYVEMHGTGTKLGDPIELEALATVYKEKTKKRKYCAIGSVKSNIGHTSAASGVASIQKVMFCLKHKQLVPTLHFKKHNQHFNFEDSPFYVNSMVKPWEVPAGEPRRASVSSFGFSGTNAHIVIEEYVPSVENGKAAANSGHPVLFILSAASEAQLKIQAANMRNWIESHADFILADLAYTLQVGRAALEYRLAFVTGSREELLKVLVGFEENRPLAGILTGRARKSKNNMAAFAVKDEAESSRQTGAPNPDWNQLAKDWVKGFPVDWEQQYGAVKPHRLSLPTYPFAREYCWVPEPDLKTGEESVTIRRNSANRDNRLLHKAWEPSTITANRNINRPIAILATQETRELALLLSEQFTHNKIIDGTELHSQLEQSEQEWPSYAGCVDLTGCGSGKGDFMRSRAQWDWITWLQRLIEHEQREGLLLLCVTKGLESFGNSAVNLTGASRAGLYRMLQSEYNHVQSRHLDVDPAGKDEEIARQIVKEMLADCEDVEICIRKGRRYRALLEEISCHDTANRSLKFPGDHVLWITGGTRGLGYLCARHFVKYYQVKQIVLTGRDTFPPREEWDEYLRNNTAIAPKIQAVRDLEADGARVKVLPVPLTDQEAVRSSLLEVKQTMGPIGGIIHCAGLTDHENPAFIRKSLAGIRRVMEPKVDGLDILYECFKNEPLQFMLLFSSVAAMIPSLAVGQSDYAMANAYMDYFAESRKQELPIISIQWPNWKTGMGEAKSKAYQQTGLLSLSDSEGLRLLDDLLSGQTGARRACAVILPAVVNPNLWKPQQLMCSLTPEPRSTARLLDSDGHRNIPDGLVKVTQQWLLKLFAGELKLNPSRIAMDTPFQDYGVDSIMLTQLLPSIRQVVKDALDPSLFYEYQTIESLAIRLAGTYAGTLSQTLMGSNSTEIRKDSSTADVPEHRGSKRGGSIIIPENPANPLEIAITGLSCRFPDADSLDEYWQLLVEGRSAIRPVPRERWGYDSPFYAGLIRQSTYFDPQFFLIPEDDARAIDPQARLLLEESLKVWYHAGYTHMECKGKPVGVYLGGRSQHRPDEISLAQVRNPIMAVGQNYLAANISHFFDLRGPSLVVDTACSSALVAMKTAIQALRDGEVESALVGGVSLLHSDAIHRMFQQRGILNREPYFHVFDGRATGVVPGEGVGVILLKTLTQALQDGDHIYAVIRALAVNNDGRTAGPASPNLQAQKEVMRTALVQSGKRPEEISYIEANGSGSEVTDLLELKALEAVYHFSRKQACGLGSIKPNIGHPLCAEGMAGLIKLVLMLDYRQWVPFLSGEQPMTHYNLESAPFYFCRKPVEWKDTPRIAAMNCFADGGTNVHLILEAWEPLGLSLPKRAPIPPPVLHRYDLWASLPREQSRISYENKFWKRQNSGRLTC